MDPSSKPEMVLSDTSLSHATSNTTQGKLDEAELGMKPKHTGSDDVERLNTFLNSDHMGIPNNEDEVRENAAGNNSIEDERSPCRVNFGILPFPEKLMSLLDSNKVTEAMRWLQDGDAFCINPLLFTESVLDKYFHGAKFESFTRKLNRWGFKRVAGQKVPPQTIAYYHKDFSRGSPMLLKNMHGGKKKLASARERHLIVQKKEDLDRDAAVAWAPPNLLNAENGNLANAAAYMGVPGNPGVINTLDRMRLELLASNSLAMDHELNRRILQQQQLLNLGFMNSQFMDMQQTSIPLLQRRDELQMQLLHQQGAVQGNDSNTWLPREQSIQPIVPGPLAALQYLESHGTKRDLAMSRHEDMASSGLLLSAQQVPSGGVNSTDNTHASIIQRLMAEQAGGDRHLNAWNDVAATTIVHQQLMDEQQPNKLPSETLAPQASVMSDNARDQQLQQILELYLIQQQQSDTVKQAP